MSKSTTDLAENVDDVKTPARVGFRGTLDAFIVVSLLGLALSCIFTFFARSFWLFDLLANLRTQQLIAAIGIGLLCLILRRWRGVALAIMIGILHLPAFQFAFPKRGDSELSDGPPLRVMTMNVLTRNQNHDAIVADIRDADPTVFAILELSGPLARRLESEFHTDYPHRLVRPSNTGNFGIGLYSSIPMNNSRVYLHENTEIETIVAELPNHGCVVIATHPLPPMGSSLFAARNRHLEEVTKLVRQTDENSMDKNSKILMGDLNLTPWSPVFWDFAKANHLHRAIDGFDITPTWYQARGFPFGLVLDHVLTTEDWHCTSHRVGPRMGSDHRSVTVQLHHVSD
ncbi:endonuclease/exonuclease/phosphatase family protein [Stieleria varia]|uniref:Endonuclease/Exonuclease/phosphatase family protein n=1 Tax=Stieleria varia TaxID=2528005 RepID=A0A5C6AS93_9BACT|nr:endonuclease/exonuclease/phosphatase family protein [Stieleria varia]TWU02139.1 Endonuclease/Exonuclease/phosphatase family protein [Stieleria varia]